MIRLSAPAKLTVSLRITGVREDGYHELDAEMRSVSLEDVLHLEPASSSSLVVRRDGLEHPGEHDDLVLAALRAVGRHARVVLDKRIPAGAGLGGGSSDAAAVLRWAQVEDLHLAASIGADVAFCLLGGRARVRGIGEQVEPLAHEGHTYTLFTPPLQCSTPVVYRRWDELGGPRGEHGNDLEPAALDAYPELASWRDRFAQRVGIRPRLAGSGSTWFVDGAHEGPGHVVVSTLPAHPGAGEPAMGT